MSADLDWTAALGEAVVADQGAVLDAVQAFRRKAQSAGNLKTRRQASRRGREGNHQDRSCRPAGGLCAAVQPFERRRVQLGSGLRLLSCAVSELLLPVRTGRRARHRLDLGRSDRRGVGWRPLRRQLGRWQQQHHDQPRHTTSTPATSTAATGHRNQPSQGRWQQHGVEIRQETRTGQQRRRAVGIDRPCRRRAWGRRRAAPAAGRARGRRKAARRRRTRRRARSATPAVPAHRVPRLVAAVEAAGAVMHSAATDRATARAPTVRAALRAAARCRAAVAVERRRKRRWRWWWRTRWRWWWRTRRRRPSLGDGQMNIVRCNHPSDRHHEPHCEVEADTPSRFHRLLRDADARYRRGAEDVRDAR